MAHTDKLALLTNVSLHPPLWRWNAVPSRPPQRSDATAPAGVISCSFPGYRGLYHPLPATVKYDGGPEAYVTITTRGWRFKFPGHVPLVHVVQSLNGQPPERY